MHAYFKYFSLILPLFCCFILTGYPYHKAKNLPCTILTMPVKTWAASSCITPLLHSVELQNQLSLLFHKFIIKCDRVFGCSDFTARSISSAICMRVDKAAWWKRDIAVKMTWNRSTCTRDLQSRTAHRHEHTHTHTPTFLHMFTPADTHTNTESTTQLDSVTHNTLQPSLTVGQNERPT